MSQPQAPQGKLSPSDYLVVLEQENAKLRAELAECRQRQYLTQQQEPAVQERVAKLTEADEAITPCDSPTGTRRNHILEATAAAANALLTVDNFDEAVSTALQIVGDCLDTDRVNIIENVHHPCSSFPHWRVLYEWDSPETIPQFSDSVTAQGSYEEIQQIFERLQQGQTMSYLLEQAPEPFRSSQTAIGVKATHLVPIFVEGQWWGVVGLDDCREAKQRSTVELSVLKIAADCIGSAIQRERTQQALLQTEQARTAELAKANEELQQRDRLLSTVAKVTRNLLENPNVDQAIAQALQRIGETASISRITLIQERLELSSGRQQHHVVQEWAVPNVPRQMDDLATKVMYNDEYGVLVEELHAGRSIWHVIENFPEPARTQQAGIGVKSTGAVPIFIQGEYFGCVAFDDCITYRQWSAHEIDVLTSASGAIGAAIHRKQLIDRLIEERIHAEQERAVELEKVSAALQQTIDVVSQLEQLDAFVPEVLRIVAEAFGASSCGYYEHPSDERIYLRHWFYEGTVYKPEQLLALDAERFSTVRLLSQGFTVPIEHLGTPHRYREHAVVIDHLHGTAIPEFHAFARRLGWGGELNVPLVCNGLALGALVIYREIPSFTDEEISLAESLGKQISLAMQTSQIAERERETAIAREQERAAQERAVELAKANHALKHSLDRLAQESDLDSFLGHVLSEIANQVQATAGHIFLLNVETNTLELCLEIQNGQLYHQARPNEPILFQSAVPADITPIFQYLCEKRTLSSLSAGEFDGIAWAGTSEWFEREGFTEAVCLALIVGEQPVGILGLAFRNKSVLKPEEAELIHALAHQATLAIQLTRLAEETKRVAIFEERNRMASEIHDTLAQSFTGIVMQLQAASRFLSTAPAQTQACMDRAQGLAREGLAEARRSVWALQQDRSDYCHISDTLIRIADQLTAGTATQAKVSVQGSPYCLRSDVGMNLLRIAQEALTNALRHAQAKTIQMNLSYDRDQVCLCIWDDGQGFDPQQISRGFGLVGMQQRANQIGAQFNLYTQPGAGTEIVVTIPTCSL